MLVTTSILLLTIGVSACSSDGTSPPDDAKNTSAAPDPAAADKAAVEQLVKDYWAAQVEAQNTGNDDPKPLLEVEAPDLAEVDIAEVKRYNGMHLLRVGKPDLTDIEVTVKGNTADIRLCLDEDDWSAEVDGEAVKGGSTSFGPRPWGAQATKNGDTWKISKQVPPSKEKICA